MEMLSVINNNEIRNELMEFGEKNKRSEDEIICSLVYEFARKLPYSIDYMDKDFVPGVFLNVSPVNPSEQIFNEYNSLYYKMISWGDTKKSGILLQICCIFQAMLMGQFPNNYELTEEAFHNLGIAQMTSDDEYNRFLFEMLKMLPEYCARVNSTKNPDERRKILDDIYMVMVDRVGSKVGGYIEESFENNVISVKESKGMIRLFPYRDLEMLYYFQGIKYGFVVRDLVGKINKIINSEINLSETNISLESDNNKISR